MPRGGGGGDHYSSLSSGCQTFPKGPFFGITLRHPFLAEQPQNSSKGAFGANITNFEGCERAAKTNCLSKLSKKKTKNAVFCPVFACGAEKF